MEKFESLTEKVCPLCSKRIEESGSHKCPGNSAKVKTTLSARERAEKMVQTMLIGIDGSYFEFFINHLRAVRQDAFNEALEEVRNCHDSDVVAMQQAQSEALRFREALIKIDQCHSDSECGFCGSKRIAKEALQVGAKDVNSSDSNGETGK